MCGRHVERERIAEILGGRAQQRAGHGAADVVDDDVQPAEHLDCCCGQSGRRFGVGEIAADHVRPPPGGVDLIGHGFEFGSCARCDDDVGTDFCESQGDGGADATAGAGDNGHAVIESESVEDHRGKVTGAAREPGSDSARSTTMSNPSPNPAIAATAVEFPPHRHTQDEVAATVADFAGSDFLRFAATTGVQARQLALPLERYSALTSFTESNAIFLDVAMELGARAVRSALDTAGLRPSEVDIVFSTTVTGVAVPTLEARLAAQIGLRSDVKRVPLFGLGCVAGAAGVARMYDYLRAYPDHVAVLLAVELCSLTIQRNDHSMANLVASSLFGDGAAAVVAVGAHRATAGPRVLASRSRLYPDSTEVMGWRIGTDGFRIVLSADVPTVVEKYLG